jgi:hypothetical protein
MLVASWTTNQNKNGAKPALPSLVLKSSEAVIGTFSPFTDA